MSQMFYQASAFNQPLSFDTSGVTEQQGTSQGVPMTYSGMQSIFDGTAALSDANKLLIRCAWAGESAFDSEYPNWVSGACQTSFATKADLEAAVQLWVSDNAAARSAHGPISG